jgi:hypothetical protein
VAGVSPRLSGDAARRAGVALSARRAPARFDAATAWDEFGALLGGELPQNLQMSSR